MSKILHFSLFALIMLFATNCYSMRTSPEETEIIKECLERFGGLTPENAARLQRYKDWSDTYEEIPCFTNCYLNRIFDFYKESVGFNAENIIKQFGQPIYNACRHRLEYHEQNKCDLAYKGFHCVISLENDPFILIESMNKLDTGAKTAMKDCLRRFDQYEWSRLSEYSSFPVREPIPCYTKCFIDKLQLFNESTRRWNIENMRAKLGIPEATADINSCLAMSRRRNRNSCTWMYREFTCLSLAK